jgi:hypothetical protein
MPLSDSDLIEMHCLGMAAESGRVPDGCDAGRYVEERLLERDGQHYSVTPLGMMRLAELRESHGEADRINP